MSGPCPDLLLRDVVFFDSFDSLGVVRARTSTGNLFAADYDLLTQYAETQWPAVPRTDDTTVS